MWGISFFPGFIKIITAANVLDEALVGMLLTCEKVDTFLLKCLAENPIVPSEVLVPVSARFVL